MRNTTARFFGLLVMVLAVTLLRAGVAAGQEVARDEGRIAAAGIRKLVGNHIVIYTDLPAAAEVDELPRVFDAAVPLWRQYFNLPAATAAEWKMTGCVMQQKERFVRAGLYPSDLPPFPNGYARGLLLWLYEQPSAYYRRHLLLHEGTHQFMAHFAGGNGPPWYSEGMAELLGTHRWENGKLTLAVMPRTKEEVPYWGRVKVVKDDRAAGRALSLLDVMNFDGRAHLKTEAYAWSWAAAAFFDENPQTQGAFRELKGVAGRRRNFSETFRERLGEKWPGIVEDWQVFVAECDYGYDFARAAVVRKVGAELPSGGAMVSVASDRGWQSTGIRLEAGVKYQVAGEGSFQVAAGAKPWKCEANGVTIRYYRGEPLGKLLAAVSDFEGNASAETPLVKSRPIGQREEMETERTGTLYLKINEAPSGLGDNAGALQVSVRKSGMP
jgi:hypothetical protein